MSFLRRLGAAVVAPGRAFAEAEAGRDGTQDAVTLLALAFVCAELPVLVGAGWTLLVIGFGPAFAQVAGRVTDQVGNALVVWAASGLAITIAAGRRRSVSRDFDLAGVVFVPYLVARLLFGLVPAPRPAEDAVAIGLAAIWVVLAVLHARRARA